MLPFLIFKKLFFSEKEESKEKRESTPKQSPVAKNCPHCGGDISELHYYKLKAGESTECEYCGKMIAP